MKWRVEIDQPAASRLVGTGKLILAQDDGWCPGPVKEYALSKDQQTFDFDLPDDVDWVGDTSICDGSTFSVTVEYTNSTGTRKEFYRPVPKKVEA